MELVEGLVKQCERFVAKEVGGMRKELIAQKGDLQAMEVRIKSLELRNQELEADLARVEEERNTSHPHCLEKMQSALMSGFACLTNDAVFYQQPIVQLPASMPDTDARPSSPEITEVYTATRNPKRRLELEETAQ